MDTNKIQLKSSEKEPGSLDTSCTHVLSVRNVVIAISRTKKDTE